jgi:hypothetical protein
MQRHLLARHLVVAYETAGSPELRAALLERSRTDPQSSFVLLVPATPRRYLLLMRDGRAPEIARRMADSARAQLEQAGISVEKAIVGNAAPLAAIAEEIKDDDAYASIIVCTHPADVSRWLKAGVPAKARHFGLPVTHIVVRSVAESAGAGMTTPPWLG